MLLIMVDTTTPPSLARADLTGPRGNGFAVYSAQSDILLLGLYLVAELAPGGPQPVFLKLTLARLATVGAWAAVRVV